MREVETDRCAECGQLGAEWHETFRRNLHFECVGAWLGAEGDYRAMIDEHEAHLGEAG